VHFNVRSIHKNIDQLAQYICQLKIKPDIIAVSETKIIKDLN